MQRLAHSPRIFCLGKNIVLQVSWATTVTGQTDLLENTAASPKISPGLRIAIISEDGRTLGNRLASVNGAPPGGYGEFFAEVPYLVSELTPALLVVYEENENTQEKIYLTSIEIVLSP